MGIENINAPVGLLPARRARRSGERGSALLEYAFTLVISLVLIFAMIDFARALYSYHFISNAAREGTRFASVRGYLCSNSANQCQAGQDDIRAFVRGIAPLGINTDPAVLVINPMWTNPSNLPVCDTTSNYPGCTVQVQVVYTFQFLFPYNLPPVSFLAGPINMSSTSQMIISR